MVKEVKKKKHLKFLLRFLNLAPSAFSTLDTQRMTICFFAISGIDMLAEIDSLNDEYKTNIIDWVYSLQVVKDEDNLSGFQGSPTTNIPNETNEYICGFVPHTYTALSILIILGDDLSRVNRKSIIKSLRTLQLPNGCFPGMINSESDMRFVYCATCICYILDDWSGMNKDTAVDFILSTISYDYGIGQYPGTESHGGSTFCAIAALSLMNRLDALSPKQRKGITRWLLLRQNNGFQGRPNKLEDTCYSFWIGASLKMLNALQLSNSNRNRKFILTTQDEVIGGFSKWPYNQTDPLHTYLGLCGLSLIGEKGLNQIMPSLNISRRAYEHLTKIHRSWKSEL